MRTTSQPRSHAWALRIALPMLVMSSLVGGIAGGLLRAGAVMPWTDTTWLVSAALSHAFLMVCSFMGTVIAIERAVAVKQPWAFAGPLASALAGIVALCGDASSAAWLVVAASLAFMTVNLTIMYRQLAAHTTLLFVAAASWAVGSVLHAVGALADAVIPWWFAFLVLTIAAERLEMTRMMRRRRGVALALYIILGVLLLSAAVVSASSHLGGALYGISLMALAGWLIAFDIARRTVRTQGLSRYMALCLLLGYGWLLVAGAAWTLTSLGFPARDAALHGVALGFVFSMMLGHTPVILPAIARAKVLYSRFLYVPVIVLHASLALRLLGAPINASALSAGAIGNALAVAVFAATIAGAAIAWRIKHHLSRS